MSVPPHSLPRSVKTAIAWMICVSLCSSVVTLISRFADGELHPFQLLFFMMACGLLVKLPHLKTTLTSGHTHPHKYYIIRSLFEVTGFSCSFFAVKYMSMPTFSALAYLVPLFISFTAIMILKEKTSYHSWLGLLIGLIGACIIIRPDGNTNFIGPLFILGMCFSFSITATLIKVLTRTESTDNIVSFMLLYTTLFSAPLAIFYGLPITQTGLILILLIGLTGFIQQKAVTKAFSAASVSYLMPITFTTLLFSAILADYFLGEELDSLTAIGAVIILSAATYSTIRNRHNAT